MAQGPVLFLFVFHDLYFRGRLLDGITKFGSLRVEMRLSSWFGGWEGREGREGKEGIEDFSFLWYPHSPFPRHV